MKHSPLRPSVTKASHRGQGIVMRLSVLAAAVCLSVAALSATPSADASIRKTTSIPAQDLGSALIKLEKERNLQVVFISEDVRNLKTQGASGELTFEEALRQILVGTGLTYRYLDQNTVTVLPSSQADVSSGMTSGSSVVPTAVFMGSPDVRLAQSDAPVTQSSPSVTENSNKAESLKNSDGTNASKEASVTRIEEVVVTAQKREERLQDVPVSVTVLNTATLAENNQNRLQDYFASVPGLNLNANSQGGGALFLVIRGITTTYAANPTVGVVVDDVPFGSSTTNAGGGFLSLDIDPSDLARVEVLKGPQGTLYGTSSMGGLVKFVTQDPSTTGFSGRVQVLGDGVDHGGFGYGVRGAVNIPVSDVFAFRASAFTRRDAGYIENATTGQHDVNQVDVYGGRISALWRPSDVVSVTLSALLQNTGANGNSVVNTNSQLQPTLGDLQQTGIRGSGVYSTEVRLYTARLNAKLGDLDFVSISGYGTNKWSNRLDNTANLGGLAQKYFYVQTATEPSDYETKKFSQEFRLSSPGGHFVEWMAGAFYTHEDSPDQLSFVANNSVTGAPVGTMLAVSYTPNTLSEYALFGDLTVHITNRFDVQLGGRESENRQAYGSTNTGLLVPTFFGQPSPFIQSTEHASGNAFTYLVTPRFQISPDFMVYARAASGYRLGGPNAIFPTQNTPHSYAPDRTYNYELGIKGNIFDHALTFDASAYYIDWKEIQLSEFNPNPGYTFDVNAGRAKSEGLELSVQARPAHGLSISVAGSVDNAVLKQNLPVTGFSYGLAGDRLPYSSRFTGSLTADQDIVHIGHATAFVGGSLSYVGLREGEFPFGSAAPRIQMPAYTNIDLHTGARSESWLFNLFVDNVTDKRGITGYSFDLAVNASAQVATVIPPRTVGLSVSRMF